MFTEIESLLMLAFLFFFTVITFALFALFFKVDLIKDATDRLEKNLYDSSKKSFEDSKEACREIQNQILAVKEKQKSKNQ